MAHNVYKIDLEKECPRCGCNFALVAVYHFGSTHKPSCGKCGLNNGEGDHKNLAQSIMHNCFYDYEKR